MTDEMNNINEAISDEVSKKLEGATKKKINTNTTAMNDIDIQIETLLPMVENMLSEYDADVVNSVLYKMVTMPRVTASSDRKINLGNYESLGIHISVPVPLFLNDVEHDLYNTVTDRALSQGLTQVNTKINDIARRVKDQLTAAKGGRK